MPRGSFSISNQRLMDSISLDSVEDESFDIQTTSLGSSPNAGSFNSLLKKTIRTNFPETWLFQLDMSE